jgi:hypothetical protein
VIQHVPHHLVAREEIAICGTNEMFDVHRQRTPSGYALNMICHGAKSDIL